ncbi:MAG: Sapep family Mn(2+)-dependent dipeptidase [Erysipelotrichaceae bacterium]|nr:Sapep family Mn(2+)-dependent dipeptidase [Erysipelotrichaceae bacterium]
MDLIDYRKLFYETLPEIVSLLEIPSVYDAQSANAQMPYGIHVCKAFAYMKRIAERDGFKVREYDGHAISFSHGKGKKRIDVVSHLDVVAADPEDFRIRTENGKLVGRGTTDMKVPMFLTYLSLKLLKERHPEINKEIRIVLGGDEERTMNDMRHYVSKAGLPDFAFTPDGSFPVGIGEKGAIMWTMEGDYHGILSSFTGGRQCNVIPDRASCVVNDTGSYQKLCEYLNDSKINGEAVIENGRTRIETYGTAAHASLPAIGHSAVVDLLKIIADVYRDEFCKNLYQVYADSYGRGFGHFISEEKMECLSLNLGVLRISEGKVFGQIDCRYPYGLSAQELTEDLQALNRCRLSLDYNDDPTLCQEDDPYVRILLETYRELTGDMSRPIISGGVSYSKVLKHCVSFGPFFPKEEHTAHQKGENIDLERCILMFRIYYEAIEKIALAEVES